MRRKHVMIDETKQDPWHTREVMEPMAKKAAVMALLYVVVALLVSTALAALGFENRMIRGWIVMAVLWIGHLDAASWRASEGFKKSSWLGRATMAVMDITHRRPALLSLLAFAPLASGLMGLGLGKAGLGVLLAGVGLTALLWLDIMLVICCWASMIAPSELAQHEASGVRKSDRVWVVAQKSAWRLACAAASWGMFCALSGWR